MKNRRIIAAAMLPVLLLCSCGQPYQIVQRSESSTADDGNEPAYSVTVMRYIVAENSPPEGEPMARAVSVCNSRGEVLSYESCDYQTGQTSRVTHSYEYNSDGTLRSRHDSDPEGVMEYEYDSSGNVSAESYTSESRGGSIVKRYTYDSHGNVLRAETSDSSALLAWYRYQYDSSGNVSVKTELSTVSGRPVSEEQLRYDSDGRISEETKISRPDTPEDSDEPGESVVERLYTYDDNGNNIRLEISYLDSSGEVQFSQAELREFDTENRMTRQEYYNNEALTWYEVYEYEEL
ncbi:MAG: hypothetical protein IJ737_01385 [Ruminococcus sp.]|nr:hypothetical protein [Ruminococcus sp.]MBR2282954.1 hypothetical protein [Ruminococcus sp.]